jgi:hypothetical protein
VADRANYLRLYDTNNWRTRFHTALPGYTQDADLLFLSGHGNVDGCCGLSSYSDPIFPLDFNDHNPVVLVTSCLTGNYQDNADSKNFAESFLNSGAAIYIGATQSSSGYQNREAAKWLYKNWDAGEPIGKVFTELERTYWKGSQTDDWWFWAYEQNLYGDPQFGATTLGTVQAPDAAALSSSTLQIEVPGYVVSHTLGLDWVTIPGGRLWMAPGQLWLPYYSTSMEVPAGTKVQDVVLTNRSGGMTDSGFNLPMVPLTVTACACTPEPYAGPVEGWFPERVYDWATLDNPDGTTTLEVAVYPFYYNPLTSDVLFFSNYAFEVITTASEVRVTGLATDKPEYQPGEPVLAEVELENAGYTQDVFVSALVKHYGSEEVVGGLLLESLIGLRGASSFSMEWDSSSAEPGTYLIEVTLEDAGGTLLDRSTELFGLGTVGGAITGFQAEPGHFAIGQSINLSLTFENTGTVPVMGTAVIQVRNEADDTVQEFSHEIANLAPGASAALEDAWDTSEAGEGTYRIVAHVAYDSTATDPAVAIVSTHSRLYLPLVVRSAGP